MLQIDPDKKDILEGQKQIFLKELILKNTIQKICELFKNLKAYQEHATSFIDFVSIFSPPPEDTGEQIIQLLKDADFDN